MSITVAYIMAVTVSLISFGVALYFFFWVKKQPSSNPTIAKVGLLIIKGANTFLRRE